MEFVWRDVRFALRQLRRTAGFAATVVLTLALGIGASSAIFCLMDGLWLHPVAVSHSGDIARIFSTTQQDQQGAFSYSEYQVLSQRANDFSGLVAVGGRGTLMANGDGTSTMLLNNVVSDNFFNVLGVHPMLGRVFTSSDAAQLRTHPGLVLGYSCWQRTFGGDPHIIGRLLPMRHGKDGIVQVEVWGVLPSEFRDVDPNSDRELWLPVETWVAFGGQSELTSHEFRWFNLMGRLAPHASVAQANDQVTAIAHALETADPAANHGRSARVLSDFSYRMENAGTTGIVLFGIVAGVVLLATLNVAHLLLARSLTRAPEVALRLSLGARRSTIARQLLIEHLLLGVLALAGGLGLAAILTTVLPRLLVLEPAMLNRISQASGFRMDWRVFGFAALLAFVTILLLSLVPLFQSVRSQLLPVLQSRSALRTEGHGAAFRRTAIWLQIAVSFTLLVSMGALIRSFLNTRTHSIGLTRNQILVAFTQDPDNPLRDQVLGDLRALPGVQHAAYGIRAPLMPSEGGIATNVLLPSHPELRDPVKIKYNAVSTEFLNVTGTRVLLGRGFTEADNTAGPAVAVVSQALARKYWPGQSPIGQVARLPKFNQGADLEARIIGVTEDAPINQVGEIPEPYMYIPFRFSHMGEMTYVIESSQNAMSLAQDARQVFIHANPLLDPMFITSLPELIRYSTGNYQMMAELVSVLGVIGLMLTIVGLYGFLAFRVTQRRREIGIRMALGASREKTAWIVVRDTAGMAAIGLTVGLGLAAGAARLEASVLFGVRPLDVVSLLSAVATLALAAAIASWLPARRAASIEPMQALRTE